MMESDNKNLTNRNDRKSNSISGIIVAVPVLVTPICLNVSDTDKMMLRTPAWRVLPRREMLRELVLLWGHEASDCRAEGGEKQRPPLPEKYHEGSRVLTISSLPLRPYPSALGFFREAGMRESKQISIILPIKYTIILYSSFHFLFHHPYITPV